MKTLLERIIALEVFDNNFGSTSAYIDEALDLHGLGKAACRAKIVAWIRELDAGFETEPARIGPRYAS